LSKNTNSIGSNVENDAGQYGVYTDLSSLMMTDMSHKSYKPSKPLTNLCKKHDLEYCHVLFWQGGG